MQVNPNLNPLIKIDLTLQDKRLQFNRPTQLQEHIEQNTNVLTEVKTTTASWENTIHAVRYNPRSLGHRLRVWCKRAIVVDHLGTGLLVSVGSLKRITGATDEQINQLKRDGKLIQFITLSLALKNLGHESNEESVASVLASLSTDHEVIHLTAPTSGIHHERLGFTMYLDRESNEVKLLNLNVQASPTHDVPLENQQAVTMSVAQPILTTTSAAASSSQINGNIVQIRNSSGEVEELEVERILGKGTFGKVIGVKSKTGLFHALKYGRKRQGNKGVLDVQQEYGIHQRIFGTRTKGIWGFQRPIIDRIAVTLNKKHPQPGEPSTKTVMANRNPIYSGGDFFDQIAPVDANRQFTHLLTDFQQLMYTLFFMEQNKMSHNDIKPENILVDVIDGVHVVHLSDLASMVFENDGDPGNKISGTPAYSSATDLMILQDPSKSIAQKHRVKAKRDVFAMGTVMYVALTGVFPYKLDPLGLPINAHYRPVNSIRPGAVPPEFDFLLERMLEFNPNQRIGRSAAWQEFNQILDQYPEVQAQIAANMQILGFDPTSVA